MKINDLKRIIELVSTKGLINEFVLQKDGKVRVRSEDQTFMCVLDYKGVELPEDLAIEDTNKLRNILSKFSGDATVKVEEEYLVITEEAKRAEIPKIDPSVIEIPEEPSLEFTTTIPDVNLKKLQEAVKNLVPGLLSRYEFFCESGGLYLKVGDKETGMITDKIAGNVDSNDRSCFAINVKEAVENLQVNPTIYMGNDYPMKLETKTDKYNLQYYLAPTIEE